MIYCTLANLHSQDASEQAYAGVDVPDSVIDIVVGLRNYLQVGTAAADGGDRREFAC